MIKIFLGAGVVTPSNPPPPTNNSCRYPSPVLGCFWKDPLMTPIPHHPTSSIYHCYPLPSTTPSPLKILIIHLLITAGHKVILKSILFEQCSSIALGGSGAFFSVYGFICWCEGIPAQFCRFVVSPP